MKIRKILALAVIASLALSGCGIVKKQAQEVKPEEPATEVTPEIIEEPEEEIDETAAVEEEMPADAVSIYRTFLGMYGDNDLNAVVDKDVALGYTDWENHYANEELSFDELYEVMKDGRNLSGDYDPVPYYSFLTVGDNTLLAVKYQGMDIYSENDDSYAVLIFNYVDGELHITDSFEEWARNQVQLSDRGFISSSGSGGAGEMVYDAGILSEDGKYQMIYYDDCVMGEWIRASIDSEMYASVYESVDASPEIAIHKFDFGDEILCAYVNENASEINSLDRQYIDGIIENGITVVSMDVIEKKIDEKGRELAGDAYEYIDNCPVIWSSIYTDGRIDIMPTVSGDTSKWNYENDVSTSALADKKTLKLLAQADKASPKPSDSINPEEISAQFEKSEGESYVLVETVKAGNGDEFKLYLSNDYDSVILAPDGGLIKFGFSLCDFIYCNVPEMYAGDYDGDGKSELVIIAYLFHGTGVSQQSLIVLNGYGNGYWNSEHLTPQDYTQAISEHLRFIDTGSDIEILYDGESAGVVSKNGDGEEVALYLDSLVDITFDGSDIVVSVVPTFWNDSNPGGGWLGTAKLTYSLEEYGALNVTDFEYSPESEYDE